MRLTLETPRELSHTIPPVRMAINHNAHPTSITVEHLTIIGSTQRQTTSTTWSLEIIDNQKVLPLSELKRHTSTMKPIH